MCEYCATRYLLRTPAPDAPLPRFDNIEIEQCFIEARQRARDTWRPGQSGAQTRP